MTEPQEVGRMFRVSYLGSHADYAATVDMAQLVFTTDGLWLVKGKEGVFFIPWRDITEISAGTREVVEGRVSASRVLLLGVVAFIAKKERVISYLVVSDTSGEWIFAIPDFGAMELHSQVQPLHTYIQHEFSPTPSQESPTHRGDARERPRRLDSLLADGLISHSEHAQRRAIIIDEL